MMDIAQAHGTHTRPDDTTYLCLGDVSMLSPGSSTAGLGLVQRSELKTDRTGQPYLSLTIACADGGRLEARWWRYPHQVDHCPQVGTVHLLTGKIERYQGSTQLRLADVEMVSEADLKPFIRSARRPLAELRADLDSLIASLDLEMSGLVRTVLSGIVFERFCEWPAAQSHHGSVRHGLLAHSLRVAHIAIQLNAAYGDEGLNHDSELVIAASLLHDVGKIYTLPSIAGGALPDSSREIDHVTLGILMVRIAAESSTPTLSQGRLSSMLHALLAHHGTREWGAPVEPQTVEAWLVHLADLAEARLWQWSGEA